MPSASELPMRVLIACGKASDEAAFLEALRQAGIGVVAAPANGVAALELTRRHRPDVVVVDDELPGLRGLAGLRRLADENANSRIVALTGRYDDQRGLEALMAGAVGYVSRGIAPRELVRLVRGVVRGEAAISRRLTMAVIELAHSEVGMRPVRSPLTTREWEVLDLMATGASQAEISSSLVVSHETVRTHVRHILRKLDVHSRADAIAKSHELRRPPPGEKNHLDR
jgi:NarL family two-component system response regulator LiaR